MLLGRDASVQSTTRIGASRVHKHDNEYFTSQHSDALAQGVSEPGDWTKWEGWPENEPACIFGKYCTFGTVWIQPSDMLRFSQSQLLLTLWHIMWEGWAIFADSPTHAIQLHVGLGNPYSQGVPEMFPPQLHGLHFINGSFVIHEIAWSLSNHFEMSKNWLYYTTDN